MVKFYCKAIHLTILSAQKPYLFWNLGCLLVRRTLTTVTQLGLRISLLSFHSKQISWGFQTRRSKRYGLSLWPYPNKLNSAFSKSFKSAKCSVYRPRPDWSTMLSTMWPIRKAMSWLSLTHDHHWTTSMSHSTPVSDQSIWGLISNRTAAILNKAKYCIRTTMSTCTKTRFLI